MKLKKQRSTLGNIRIEIDGQLLTSEVLSGLSKVRVMQFLSKPTQAEIVLNAHLGLSAESLPRICGSSIKISLFDQNKPLFQGTVTAVDRVLMPDGSLAIHLRAYDALHSLFQRQQIRAHVQSNIQALASEWVGSIGLTVESHIDDAPPKWNWKLQYRETDGAYLMTLAHKQGYYFYNQGTTVSLVTLQGDKESVISLSYGDNLRECRQSVNAHYQCEGVQVSGWNPTEAKIVKGLAGEQNQEQSIRFLSGHCVSTQAEAERTAAAVLDRCKSGENQLWGVAEGDTELYPGRRISYEDFTDNSERQFALTSVIHTFDTSSGYASEFNTHPPELRDDSSTPTAAMPAIVSNIDDPKNAGRVKVHLITCGDVETDWLYVIQNFAGKNKGLLALPSCGDHVVFMPLADDPAQAVVLSGIYGEESLPDKPVKNSKVNRYAFHTPKGHYLRFDESAEEVTLRHHNGSFLCFSADKTQLLSKTNLVLEAPNRKITIRGNKVDFEKG